ncbi:response regulator transcription factor [Sphingomonas sp.]|uniref:response regulator transcription factor n=1 Tax=Sphingomonas sp. TaxID=28214 RepID=UPI00333FBA02
MLRRALLYGLVLAASALSLQWLDYRRLVLTRTDDVYLFGIAAAFLGAGLLIGARVIGRTTPIAFDGNPKAVTALGISPRELRVLEALAAGQSNKEIARELQISPNTIKTHVSRLFEKLDASRRTEAINKARTLGIVR